MNTKLVNSAAGVILAALTQNRTAAGIALALDSAQMLLTPETAAEMGQLQDDIAGACLARFEEEQENARLRLALASAQRGRRELRARVAELEQREATVAGFVTARAEYITSIRNCHPDNGHDYDRWQGHAAARRQLAEELGLPVAWPAEDAASVAKSAAKLTALLAPTQALREDDDPGRCLKVHAFSPRDGWRMICSSCDHGKDAECHRVGAGDASC